jgi:hypothetical protein
MMGGWRGRMGVIPREFLKYVRRLLISVWPQHNKPWTHGTSSLAPALAPRDTVSRTLANISAAIVKSFPQRCLQLALQLEPDTLQT